MIAVIDYGAGNIQSVMNALRFLGAEAKLAGSPDELADADAVLLPGVGSFGDAMRNLQAHKFDLALKEWAAQDKPFLGICLGMQVLFESSEESPDTVGLGILKGRFKKFSAAGGLKVPHVGWNSLDRQEIGLFRNIAQNSYVYFVHSYYLQADEPIVSAKADYGVSFDAAVQKGRLWACQFHPEKSGEVGLAMLQNFLNSIG